MRDDKKTPSYDQTSPASNSRNNEDDRRYDGKVETNTERSGLSSVGSLSSHTGKIGSVDDDLVYSSSKVPGYGVGKQTMTQTYTIASGSIGAHTHGKDQLSQEYLTMSNNRHPRTSKHVGPY